VDNSYFLETPLNSNILTFLQKIKENSVLPNAPSFATLPPLNFRDYGTGDLLNASVKRSLAYFLIAKR
jgi:hypothetical protein